MLIPGKIPHAFLALTLTSSPPTSICCETISPRLIMPFILVHTSLHKKLRTYRLTLFSIENPSPLLGFIFVFSKHHLLTRYIFYFVFSIECFCRGGMEFYLFIHCYRWTVTSSRYSKVFVEWMQQIIELKKTFWGRLGETLKEIKAVLSQLLL